MNLVQDESDEKDCNDKDTASGGAEEAFAALLVQKRVEGRAQAIEEAAEQAAAERPELWTGSEQDVGSPAAAAECLQRCTVYTGMGCKKKKRISSHRY